MTKHLFPQNLFDASKKIMPKNGKIETFFLQSFLEIFYCPLCSMSVKLWSFFASDFCYGNKQQQQQTR